MSDDLRSVLLQIREARGALTPAAVVDTARDPTHPLHSRFEWDDAVAAEAHRRAQAAKLIRSVRITYDYDDDGAPKTVRGLVSIQRELAPTRTYEPVEEVVADPVASEILLREFDREWRRFRQRFGHLQEFTARIAADLDLHTEASA